MAKHGSNHDAFSHSMTDLMAGVAVTFLLIAAIFMVQVSRTDAKAREEGLKARTALKKIESTDAKAKAQLVRLRDRLQHDVRLSKLVNVLYHADQDPFLLTIVLDRKQFRFDNGKCDLHSEAWSSDTRSSLGSIFTEVCETANTGFVQSIMLEGHTDNQGFFPATRTCGIEPTLRQCQGTQGTSGPDASACEALGFENNVRLSAARALSAFFEMRKLLDHSADVSKCLDTRFVVAGRGPVDPADKKPWRDTRSEKEKEANRRVVIKVRAMARSEAMVSP